ncbi:hypothetical protein K431DRAFT_154299 [Polychaeton citri CBS 116435]|uniref:Uncharacterized protein n=1 Tax=Polychaeton citri CBS 116435 TaxID=1314669 RepID=A0A9P4QD39_9PEZI|nr:hypothetical protein K431DRAFT_154299 [Polychaeton citri CBS 116435]
MRLGSPSHRLCAVDTLSVLSGYEVRAAEGWPILKREIDALPARRRVTAEAQFALAIPERPRLLIETRLRFARARPFPATFALSVASFSLSLPLMWGDAIGS